MKKQYNVKPLLLTPGPVPIPEFILNNLSKPMIHHRCSEFEDIFKQTKALLKKNIPNRTGSFYFKRFRNRSYGFVSIKHSVS